MPEFSDKPGARFGIGPDKRTSTFLDNKGIHPSFSWADTSPEEHAVSFTAAKVMTLDVAEALKRSLSEAIKNGVPFEQWKRQIRPELERKGWWGVKEFVDPTTGELKQVQLGSPRRLKTIYSANIRSARAAGQWDRIQKTKEARPYLIYELGPSERHRPEHAALRGLVLRADDPFWHSHFPPNGWGCKCRVRQLSQTEVDRRGLVVTDAPKVATRDWKNPRTGEVTKIPKGIDPGWETNPGVQRHENLAKLLAGRLELMDAKFAKAAVRDMVDDEAFARLVSGRLPMTMPVAWISSDMAAKIGAKVHRVDLSNETMDKQRREHPELTLEEYRLLPDLFERALVLQQSDVRLIYFRSLGKLYKVVIKSADKGREIYLLSFHRTNPGEVAREKSRSALIVDHLSVEE